jgi:hypothetical protein
MANLGYILKESVMTASKTMTDAEFRELITGFFNYAVYGTVPQFENVLSTAIFEMEKPSIDYNNKKWQDREKVYSSVNKREKLPF